MKDQVKTTRNVAGKRSLALGVAATMVLLVTAACADQSSDKSASSSDSNNATLSNTNIKSPEKDDDLSARIPKELSEKGYVTVASSAYPTAVIVPSDGSQIRGWEVSTAEALGEILGIDFRQKIVPFDSIIPGLSAGRYDIAMGSIAITPDRLKEVTFVRAHATKNALMVTADSSFNPQSMLDVCGKKLAVLSGSIQVEGLPKNQADCKEADRPEIEVATFKTQADLTLSLANGRVDVQFAGSDTLAAVMAAKEDAFKMTTEFDSPVPSPVPGVDPGDSGIAVAETDYSLKFASVLSDAMNILIEDGTQQAILDKWNNGKGAVDESIVVSE